MIRLGKLTDYGLVLMTCMARSHSETALKSENGDIPQSSNPHPSPLKLRMRHPQADSIPTGALRTARDLAAETKLPVSTVSKLLKHLLQSGLLASHRGTKGGYLLARDPHEISVLEVIAAVEGSMALTECSTDVSGCQIETGCPIKSNQRIINQAIRGVLEKVMLSDLANPMQLTSITDVHGRALSVIGPAIASRIQ
ncbi:MAG: Rrf2 family transcriptional regulator [Acidobacteriota bacterium]|nr:Rrf2 family transcriptional regulator [Acidobacteriota bacterium]MDE3169503.1 Rrf2 family transcriptional regulator [Acidobacteriota bacterium]